MVGAPPMTSQPVSSILSLFSTALWDLANSRPVHSLMLSSHLFFCLPCLLSHFTVPSKMVSASRDERETSFHSHSFGPIRRLRHDRSWHTADAPQSHFWCCRSCFPVVTLKHYWWFMTFTLTTLPRSPRGLIRCSPGLGSWAVALCPLHSSILLKLFLTLDLTFTNFLATLSCSIHPLLLISTLFQSKQNVVRIMSEFNDPSLDGER